MIKKVDFTTNSNYQDQSVLYFKTNSPELIITPVEKGEYQVNMQVYEIDSIIADKINSLHNNYQNQKNKLDSVEKDFKKLHSKYQDQKDKINILEKNLKSLHNSFSWKITKPVRFIGKILRKILKHKKREV